MNVTEKNVQLSSSLLEEEESIILRSKTDPECFRPLYEKYFRKIYLFILHRVGDKEVTADIAQQVFFKALINIGKFQLRGLPFSSWLYRVAINECNEYFRKTRKAHFVVLEKETFENLHEELTGETKLELLEQKLPDILQKLNPQELVLIELRFFDKRSFHEIGEITGCTELNAKIRTYRVLKKMKKFFLL